MAKKIAALDGRHALRDLAHQIEHQQTAVGLQLHPAGALLPRGNFQSLADTFGEKIANFCMERDGLNEAVGGIDPDGMPPAFALQHATLLLQVADEFAAFHAVRQHPGPFLLQGKSTGCAGKLIG